MRQTAKNDRWIRFRHKVGTKLAFFFLLPYVRLFYGARVERFRGQKDRPYLILYNHQTPFDQFFVGLSFRGPVYYLASEDIFSKGWISRVIRWLVAPIPIKKQTLDINAIKTCIQVSEEGGIIAIAPEGNRTYSGKTEYMSPGIASLAKRLKLPVALFRIEGGYGVQPRWSDVIRKGKMRAYVSRVIEPGEYEQMTADELFDEIRKGLYVNEAAADGIFRSGKRAEFLERAVYICPYCGPSSLQSHKNTISCPKCRRKVVYGKDKKLTGEGFEFPFEFVNDWYEYQKRLMNTKDVTKLTAKPIFTDTSDFYEVILYQNKKLLRKESKIEGYGDRIVIDGGTPEETVFPYKELGAVTVLGRNKLNIYAGDRVYQLKSGKRFNALKYVHVFNRYNNIVRGDEDGKFLGL